MARRAAFIAIIALLVAWATDVPSSQPAQTAELRILIASGSPLRGGQSRHRRSHHQYRYPGPHAGQCRPGRCDCRAAAFWRSCSGAVGTWAHRRNLRRRPVGCSTNRTGRWGSLPTPAVWSGRRCLPAPACAIHHRGRARGCSSAPRISPTREPADSKSDVRPVAAGSCS